MNETPQPTTPFRIAFYVLLAFVLFLDDFLFWILGESRVPLVESIVGVVLVGIAVSMFFIREPGVRRIAAWLCICWLAMAALHFGRALGIPRSEMRAPFLIGIGILAASALAYWLFRRPRRSHPL